MRIATIVAYSLAAAFGAPAAAQSRLDPRPMLHHVGLNSVDPERAIAWYLRLWPTARRTTVAGLPAVESDMLLLFTKVAQPPKGAWREDLHRAEDQSAFWHIGAFTDATTTRDRLAPLGITHLPLFVRPGDAATVWRSGLAPSPGGPRPGGFSYVVGPDGVLIELTGGPDTKDSFSHVHFYHEQPLCAANWYVEHLGMTLPPLRDSTGRETPRLPYAPCEMSYGEASWPALEPGGTLRQPSGTVRYANGSMSWYPRQCVAGRCGADRALVPSRGQVLDHVAFTVTDFDALYAALTRDGVRVLERPHPFGDTRAMMIEDPDGLSIELVERRARPEDR